MIDKCPEGLNGETAVLYSAKVGSIPTQGSCSECGKPTTNPKYCSRNCSAKANNRLFPRRATKISKHIQGKTEPPGICDFCKLPFANTSTSKKRKFCSVKCSVDIRTEQIIQDWLDGKTSGISTLGTVSVAIKNWLRRTRGDQCEKCGWNEVNPVTGKVPVVADHIDGNWRNNRPENLRLLCPNCDSLQPTYKALNKNGREWRRTKD